MDDKKDLVAEKHKKWLKKRKFTFIAFSIQMIIIGMEWSLTIVTLWSYIKEMIKTSKPKLYYGLVSVSYMLSCTVITPFIGRFADKGRKINTCFLMCNTWMLIGNVVYSLPFSPYLLIGGRTLTGFGGALKSVIFSETVRCYQAADVNSKLSILSMMLNLGHWHLRYVNFPGVFMGIVCFAMEIITMTMVHDVSKEFDYKALEKTDSLVSEVNNIHVSDQLSNEVHCENSPLLQSIYNKNNANDIKTVPKTTVFRSFNPSQYTAMKILKVLFTNFDSALILFSNFFIAFFFINTDIWLPLLIIEKMHLTVTEMNICFFGVSGICAIMLLRIIWRPLSDLMMLNILFLSLSGFCTVSAGFIVLSYFPYYKVLNVMMCIVYMVSFAGAPVIIDVFFVNTLSLMVNSNILTFVDSIRFSTFTAGALLAFSFSAFIFDYVEIFGSLYIIVMIIIGILFLVRKKYFINPKLLI